MITNPRSPGTRSRFFFKLLFLLIFFIVLSLLSFFMVSTSLAEEGPDEQPFLRRLGLYGGRSDPARAPPPAPAPPPPQPPAAARALPPALPPGPRGDPDPIHLAFALCGNPNEVEKDHYGLLFVKSLMMAKAHNAGSGRHYVVHVMTNVAEEELFNTTRLNWEVYRALQREVAAGTMSYHVYSLADLDAATRAALGGEDPNLAVPHHIFKNCAASRLKLPFLLGGKVDRILYLDWDAVTFCDLTRLWVLWDTFNSDQLLGFAAADPSGVSERDVYRIQDLPRHPTFGAVNSGVMMMHIGRMYGGGTFALAREFWRGASAVIRSKVNVTGTAQDYWTLTKAFALGDQDILNMLFQRKSAEAPWGAPQWLFVIPQEYNWCIDPPFLEDVREDANGLYKGLAPKPGAFNRPAPCIVHYCGNRLMSVDAGKEFLDVRDPIQASFMWIKHWPLERPEEVRCGPQIRQAPFLLLALTNASPAYATPHPQPPGIRPPYDGNDPSTWGGRDDPNRKA